LGIDWSRAADGRVLHSNLRAIRTRRSSSRDAAARATLYLKLRIDMMRKARRSYIGETTPIAHYGA
jgi:hypothetical protein